MQKIFLTVDKISTFVGQCFAWLICGLTALIGFEVFSRYVLNNPHPWAFDAQIMMYGTMFMMAGAYTLSKNGHVRGDGQWLRARRDHSHGHGNLASHGFYLLSRGSKNV